MSTRMYRPSLLPAPWACTPRKGSSLCTLTHLMLDTTVHWVFGSTALGTGVPLRSGGLCLGCPLAPSDRPASHWSSHQSHRVTTADGAQQTIASWSLACNTCVSSSSFPGQFTVHTGEAAASACSRGDSPAWHPYLSEARLICPQSLPGRVLSVLCSVRGPPWVASFLPI